MALVVTRERCEGRGGRKPRLRGGAGGHEERLGSRLLRILSPGPREVPKQVQKEIRIFLCDDVGDVRLLTRTGLEESSDLRVVGEADNGPAAVEGITEVRPDVVLVDLSMPGMDGFDLIPLIRERAPDVGILVFSGFAADRMESGALEVGADAYLEKGESFERLRDVTREVARLRPTQRAEDGA
jgi:CheY-like chemotaxis protein